MQQTLAEAEEEIKRLEPAAVQAKEESLTLHAAIGTVLVAHLSHHDVLLTTVAVHVRM